MTVENQQPLDIIYHYTDTYGLLGILEHKELWATDALLQNDTQELKSGRLELAAMLNEQGRSLANVADDAVRSCGEVMQSAAETLRGGFPPEGEPYANVYVACFCQNGDLLSQWRGYAKGSGYAIGFHFDQPPNAPWDWLGAGEQEDVRFAMKLVQIDYDPLAVHPLASRIMTEIEPTGFPGAHGWSEAIEHILPALAGIKNKSFSEERE